VSECENCRGRRLDPVEIEYERAIAIAARDGDNDRAYEVSRYLIEYREQFKVPAREKRWP